MPSVPKHADLRPQPHVGPSPCEVRVLERAGVPSRADRVRFVSAVRHDGERCQCAAPAGRCARDERRARPLSVRPLLGRPSNPLPRK
jgi:hypothetical protein